MIAGQGVNSRMIAWNAEIMREPPNLRMKVSACVRSSLAGQRKSLTGKSRPDQVRCNQFGSWSHGLRSNGLLRLQGITLPHVSPVAQLST